MANKYSSLASLKAYLQVTTTAEDATLQSALDWAEGEFERLAGSQFDQATETDELPSEAFVDRNGLLHVVALARGPVTAVTAVSIRYLTPAVGLASSWQVVAWNAGDIFLPPASAPPHPRAWRVSIMPSTPTLVQKDVEGIAVKWTYTGGYAAAPVSLVMIVNRLAAWKYKLREAPLGKVASPPFGITEIIPAIPKDISQDILRWTKLTF